MPKCFYCGEMYQIPRGVTLVLADGTIRHICSSKCNKNMILHRKKKKWASSSKILDEGESKASGNIKVIEEKK